MSHYWPNPFRKDDENTRKTWNVTFQWTPEHMTLEQMMPLRYSYDVLGEECLNRLDAISPPPQSPLRQKNPETAEAETAKKDVPQRDLYVLLRDNASEDPKLKELWDEVNIIPEWVDWDQIARGQDVFYRYGGPALTALTYQSLLGGMGSARIVEVLSRTGGFGAKIARHRMFETTQHILQVTSSLDSIKPGGDGFASSIRVRLLHASVRRRIMNLANSRPSYYSVAENGVPINDLDSIGTIVAFSASLIWLGFPRQGIYLRQQEIEDYIALWRLVAFYLGTPTSQFETPEKAKRMMESILLYEVNPSETSQKLANNIIVSLADTPPAYASREFMEMNSRWLNGNELCDALGLRKPSIYYWILMAGQCILFICMSYTYRSFTSLDKKNIAHLRKAFFAIVVEDKKHGLGEKTNFDFKYIPDYHALTEKGETQNRSYTGSVERLNLLAFFAACVALAAVSWLGLKSLQVGWVITGNLFSVMREKSISDL